MILLRTALIFGRARGVWDEVEAACQLGTFHTVIAVGSAGVDYPGRFEHWVSFHDNLLPTWAERRAHQGRPPAQQYWSSRVGRSPNAMPRRSKNGFPVTYITCEGGSSGYIATAVALQRLEIDRIVLAGIPMDPARGQYDAPKPWREGLKHRFVWEQNKARLAGKVKSMSGWTAELLGSPTAAWLEGTEHLVVFNCGELIATLKITAFTALFTVYSGDKFFPNCPKVECWKLMAGERERAELLLARQEARIGRAFATYVQNAQDANARSLDYHLGEFADVIWHVMAEVGRAEAKAFNDALLRKAVTVVTFDPGSPRAAELLRNARLRLVRELSESQRETIRSALAEALSRGQGATAAARAFRGAIGLTRGQLAAVENYRRLLEAGSAEVLERDLRDRRYDRGVNRALQTEEPLSSAAIDRMVERYRQRYLMYRSETIARTEALRATSLAKQEALEQAIENAGLDRDAVRRVWHSTRDHRTRDTHRAMQGQVRGIDEPFESPTGEPLMYPGDPDGSAEEVINCRCVLTHQILTGAEATEDEAA